MRSANIKLQGQQKSVALVHDYLREYGGAERVLEELHQLFPEAPVYVGFVDPQALGSHWHRFADWDIRTTWLARVPGIKRFFSPLRLFAPHAFSKLDLSPYDIVISSTNAYMAKAVKVPNGKHICYCHTPPRALYGYSTMSDWKRRWRMRLPGELINHVMRMFDFSTAQKVDVFIANSQETAKRIQKFYRRESTVVHPPVQIPKKLSSQEKPADPQYYLYVNRLAFAKHPEIAIKTCIEMDLPIKVVGTGPLLEKLQRLVAEHSSQIQTGKTQAGIEFMGSVSDKELFELYAGAKALLYPVEDEDFGMVPIEAMGYGVPVIAHASGGPLETIVDGKMGVLFSDLSVEGLKKAINQFLRLSLKKQEIHTHAKQYSAITFQEKIKQISS